MPVNIAVPNNPIFNRLYNNHEPVAEKYGARILPVDEKQCAELFHTSRVDAALISPIGYGRGVLNADYRIIPGPMLAAYGYSGFATLFFNTGITHIKSCASETPDDFLMQAGRIALSERYNIDVDIISKKGEPEKLLKSVDTALAWRQGSPDGSALDICEMWADSFNLPLPLAFWACKAEEHPKDIDKIITELTDLSLPVTEDVRENYKDENDFTREGKLFWKWDDDMEYALDQTIHMLYYRQYIPEIGAVKLFGRD